MVFTHKQPKSVQTTWKSFNSKIYMKNQTYINTYSITRKTGPTWYKTTTKHPSNFISKGPMPDIKQTNINFLHSIRGNMMWKNDQQFDCQWWNTSVKLISLWRQFSCNHLVSDRQFPQLLCCLYAIFIPQILFLIDFYSSHR